MQGNGGAHESSAVLIQYHYGSWVFVVSPEDRRYHHALLYPELGVHRGSYPLVVPVEESVATGGYCGYWQGITTRRNELLHDGMPVLLYGAALCGERPVAHQHLPVG